MHLMYLQATCEKEVCELAHSYLYFLFSFLEIFINLLFVVLRIKPLRYSLRLAPFD